MKSLAISLVIASIFASALTARAASFTPIGRAGVRGFAQSLRGGTRRAFANRLRGVPDRAKRPACRVVGLRAGARPPTRMRPAESSAPEEEFAS